MERVRVKSSNIMSIGYDEDMNMLEIEFKHNRIYQYYGVEPSVYESLMKADSHGKFFNAHIINKYRYKEV